MTSPPRPNLISRAFNRAGRFTPGVRALQAELRAERERGDRLEAELSRISSFVDGLGSELDDLRRDSLRVAELTDLIEQRLLP